MSSCQVISIDSRIADTGVQDELPCWSALMSDGVAYIPPPRFKAKIYAFAAPAVRCDVPSPKADGTPGADDNAD